MVMDRGRNGTTATFPSSESERTCRAVPDRKSLVFPGGRSSVFRKVLQVFSVGVNTPLEVQGDARKPCFPERPGALTSLGTGQSSV